MKFITIIYSLITAIVVGLIAFIFSNSPNYAGIIAVIVYFGLLNLLKDDKLSTDNKTKK